MKPLSLLCPLSLIHRLCTNHLLSQPQVLLLLPSFSRGAVSNSRPLMAIPWISPPSPPPANPSPPNVNVPETLLDPSRPISTPISSTSHPQSSAFPLQSPYTSHVMGLKTPIPHLGTSPSTILNPKPTDFLSLTVENASGCGCSDCFEEIDVEFQCPCARPRPGPGRYGFSEDVGGLRNRVLVESYLHGISLIWWKWILLETILSLAVERFWERFLDLVEADSSCSEA